MFEEVESNFVGIEFLRNLSAVPDAADAGTERSWEAVEWMPEEPVAEETAVDTEQQAAQHFRR